ncbi:MAG: ATP synthase F1 subunit delta [Bacillota bacterium]|nr:MAG: ATP synthase F1 subunit delta [Bacillota bacterium]
MAQGSLIERRYAQALFQAARNAGTVDEVERELDAVVRALFEDTPVRDYFLSDRAGLKAKRDLVLKAAAGAGQYLVRNFLLLCVDKRRERSLPGILRVFTALADKARGIVDAQVRTAVDIGPEGRADLEKTLTRTIGQRVRVNFAVDPALIGGLVLKVDDRLYDASLARRLERLAEHLAKARVGVK